VFPVQVGQDLCCKLHSTDAQGSGGGGGGGGESYKQCVLL